ncbi:hypothetical protein GCM10027184_69810 [Saccharothrix stipae]
MTQMGGEGTQWIGIAPFLESRHFVQNIGDGTFTHSGSLAVRAAVAAGINVTYKLLHNSAVAMTGGQDAVGGLPAEKIAALLLLEGVQKVVVTSDAPRALRRRRYFPAWVQVLDRSELLRAQEELAAIPGVTVLIHDQECAAEKRRKRRRGKQEAPAARGVINERVCEGCGDCGVKSNCLSVQPVPTEFGRKTAIHQSSCNVNYSCLDGDCPSFLTVVPGGAKPRREAVELAFDDSPEPSFAGTELHRAHQRHRRHGGGHGRAGPGHGGGVGRATRAHARPDRTGAEGRRGRVGPEGQRGARCSGTQAGRR